LDQGVRFTTEKNIIIRPFSPFQAEKTDNGILLKYNYGPVIPEKVTQPPPDAALFFGVRASCNYMAILSGY
jgi:hypothetical protein